MKNFFKIKYLFQKAFWNLHSYTWDEYLKTSDYSNEINTFTKIVSRYKTNAKSTLLDIGCATGNYSIEFAKAGHIVTGIDYAAFMIQKANQKTLRLKLLNTSFIQIDFNKGLDFPSGSFDFVIASHILKGVSNVNFFVSEVKRVIKDDGFFILNNKKHSSRNKTKMKERLSLTGRLIYLLKLLVFKDLKKTKANIEETDRLVLGTGFELVESTETENNYVVIYKKIQD